jgi:exodeoxyribonuclease VII small subunit
MATKVKAPADFEAAIAELEQIVLQIENNEVKLDTALEKYQHGMALVKFCQEKLTEVEQKVKILDTETDSLKDFNIV